MKNIFIKTKSDGRLYRAENGNLELADGDEVLFEYEQNQEVGVISASQTVESVNDEATSVTLIRKLNQKDCKKCAEHKIEARKTMTDCLEKIQKHGLSMELLDADLSFDGKKLTFYFSAPGRIDFRSLVPDLASTFKKLIRLQQVSSRDKARWMDGVVGRCGRDVCCRQFLSEPYEDVTPEMANTQNIGQMGSNRTIGTCGKTMCCLKYELSLYEEAKKKMPAVGSIYKTSEGEGIVISQNVMINKIIVELKDGKKRVEVDC